MNSQTNVFAAHVISQDKARLIIFQVIVSVFKMLCFLTSSTVMQTEFGKFHTVL